MSATHFQIWPGASPRHVMMASNPWNISEHLIAAGTNSIKQVRKEWPTCFQTLSDSRIHRGAGKSAQSDYMPLIYANPP